VVIEELPPDVSVTQLQGDPMQEGKGGHPEHAAIVVDTSCAGFEETFKFYQS
jgi:hypothetical protein